MLYSNPEEIRVVLFIIWVRNLLFFSKCMEVIKAVFYVQIFQGSVYHYMVSTSSLPDKTIPLIKVVSHL